MKKFFSFALMGIVALFMASCSEDDTLSTQSSDTSIVTFTVSQPGIQTRAFSDGTSASTLYYAVYQVTDDSLKYVSGISGSKENAFDDNLQATVTLQLVNGNEYDIIFWAQSPDAEIYTLDFDSSTPSVSIDTEKYVSSVEANDAFYKFHEVGVVTGNISETIELTRPLAQLNWGTNDLEAVEAAGVSNLQTKVTISGGIGNKLTFQTGEVENTDDEVVFAVADIPDGEDFPVSGYEYINMNYILFAADKGTVDATLTVSGTGMDGHEVEVSQVPLQRNYRTNIYGSLLTSTVDYTIEIVPEYEEPDYDWPIVTVTTQEELEDALGNGGTINFRGDITVTSSSSSAKATRSGDSYASLKLTNDVELVLNGYTLTAYNIVYTAENVSIINGDDSETKGAVVLTTTGSAIQSTTGGASLTLSDLTLTTSNANAAICTGATAGTSTGDNITLTNVDITCKSTGLLIYGSENTIVIDGSTINHGYFGITQQGTNTPGSNFTLTNTTISGTYSGLYLASSSTTSIYNTLYVDSCDITTNEETAIEVRKTNITVQNSTLTSKYSGKQKYSYSGSGSNGYGFGVMLAATPGYPSSPYDGNVSLSNITYNLSATANPSDTTAIWNACYYDGSAAAKYEKDGAVTEVTE